MSTKWTLVHGPGFELSTDLIDDHSGQGEVTLSLAGPGVEFEASGSGHGIRVSLTIPRAVWHVLRQHGAADPSLIGLTDEDLHQRATEMVRRRMTELAGEPKDSLLRILGMGTMGSADDPEDVQVARAVEELFAEREAQREMAANIRRLTAKDDATAAGDFPSPAPASQ